MRGSRKVGQSNQNEPQRAQRDAEDKYYHRVPLRPLRLILPLYLRASLPCAAAFITNPEELLNRLPD